MKETLETDGSWGEVVETKKTTRRGGFGDSPTTLLADTVELDDSDPTSKVGIRVEDATCRAESVTLRGIRGCWVVLLDLSSVKVATCGS